MANSLPFNAVAVDGEYDRVYKAEDWAWYFATFIANGIFPKPSDGLQVVAYSGMEIRVNAGYAFINGYAFRNPATLSVTLDTAEGALNRVDRVVVRWDLPQRDMYIAVLKGTPSAKPTATAVTRTTEIWELALADIYVGKGVTRIQTQNITDQRFNSAVCGIVTGTVEEIDASVLTKQFTDFFNTYSAAVLDEFSAYKQSMEKYLTEIAGVYDSYVSKTEGLFAQYERQCGKCRFFRGRCRCRGACLGVAGRAYYKSGTRHKRRLPRKRSVGLGQEKPIEHRREVLRRW